MDPLAIGTCMYQYETCAISKLMCTCFVRLAMFKKANFKLIGFHLLECKEGRPKVTYN
jgi:hypothetical protein